MSNLKRMTVGELRKLIKDLPDDVLVLGYEDHRPITDIFVKEGESCYHHNISIVDKDDLFDGEEECYEGYELKIKQDMKINKILLIDFT